MNRLKVKILTNLFLLFALTAAAQTNPKKEQLLSIILESISEEFNVSFSYADENIINKTILIPDENSSIETRIAFIENKTNLVFQKLDSKSYIIRISIRNTQFLNEVLLTKFLTEGISLKTDGSSKIDLKEFGILPGLIEPDVLQTIQALPGITSIDERVSNLNIRGGTNDQNLILWDNIKMYQSGHFFGLISAFNPSLINTVTVSKNGSSAQFGDGVSGIIHMQTSDSISRNLNGGLGSNLIAADGFVKLPVTEKIEIQVSARRSLTDVINTPTYNQYFDRIFQDSDLTNLNDNSLIQDERFYFYDVSSKLNYQISQKDHLTISGLKIFNSLDYQENATSNSQLTSSNSELIQESLALGLKYKRDWNNKFSTVFRISMSNYELNSTNNDITNSQVLKQVNDVKDNRFEFQANYQINNNLNYLGGYQYSEIGMSNLEDVNNPKFRRYVKDVLRSHGLYNEVSFKSNSGNTKAKIGLRANYVEEFSEFFLEPRLTINQNISNCFRIELLAEIKSQTTSQIIDLQDDFLGVEKRRWILSNNDNIPILQSQQASIGGHYLKNKLLISLEAYIKNVDGITSRSQGFQNQYQFINATGSYLIKGVDFLVNKQFKSFSTWLGYSFSTNDYNFSELNNGQPFPNNIDLRHQLTFAGTYAINQLKIAFGMNWHSGRPITHYNESNPLLNNSLNFLNPNNSNLSNYFRADCSATYKFKIFKKYNGHLGLSIWNLFNTKNLVNSYFTLSEENNIFKNDIESLGITPNATLRLTF